MSGQEPHAVVHERLSKYPGERYRDGWDELWNRGDVLPWDRGMPNPALEDTLTQGRALLGKPAEITENGIKRKKALVPGCGRGVDVLLLASFGYDAYGLEYSASAIEVCKQEEAKNADKYPVRDEQIGRGSVTFVHGDFFEDDWLEKIGVPRNGFDLVYDYTFFCALNPSMRPKWALRHTQLLAPAPRGNLICLEFPTHKDPLAPGPPFAAPSDAYMEHLSYPGEEIPYDDKGRIKANLLRPANDNGMERVSFWQPERTHDKGKDATGEVRDRVSVWRLR
ncbi:thiol methyltransferase [Paecilomyces variotii No. 5]|uniref:Thiol methyltransferase n=1 Tax=Byssochlamys spectabilis (strain No. 5 / NBRC 109023) TaxID=1356009 RepID=V5FE08_BYSSN|nr:thiol methyltransferase [Paecilomyces variotii No. 5]